MTLNQNIALVFKLLLRLGFIDAKFFLLFELRSLGFNVDYNLTYGISNR